MWDMLSNRVGGKKGDLRKTRPRSTNLLLMGAFLCVRAEKAQGGTSLSGGVDLVTFVMSIRRPAPSSPSSVTANAAFIVLIISLFSYVCDFITGHLPVLV
ncbi:hypothetical protein ACET6Q_00985 [Aeromonas dhakensis]|uniref:hypothetical protein n=1 Tax=Aeromonas dhakensis TaxID=196024 RepID=UPI0038D1D850